MEKSTIKCYPTYKSIYQKGHLPQSTWIYPGNTGLVQHMQVIDYNKSYKWPKNKILMIISTNVCKQDQNISISTCTNAEEGKFLGAPCLDLEL